MPQKTIYVKPGKQALYEKALKLANADSLSSLLEEAVENLVREKEGYFRWILLVAALGRTLTPIIFQELIIGFEKYLAQQNPDLWRRANHALDVMRHVGFFDEERGTWEGPLTGTKNEQGIAGQLWYRGIADDLTWLDELCEIATGAQFADYESEYKSKVLGEVRQVIGEAAYEKLESSLHREMKGGY